MKFALCVSIYTCLKIYLHFVINFVSMLDSTINYWGRGGAMNYDRCREDMGRFYFVKQHEHNNISNDLCALSIYY